MLNNGELSLQTCLPCNHFLYIKILLINQRVIFIITDNSRGGAGYEPNLINQTQDQGLAGIVYACLFYFAIIYNV